MPSIIPRFLAASVISVFLLSAVFISCAMAERSAGWWDHANTLAQREGYKVITTMELKELYQGKKEFVILDNRFPYELSDGLLPGAKNVSFDLSELQVLSEEKKEQLLEAAGPDMDRIIVTYCRDFR
jgi:phage shock protein E